jgi:ARG and Rhodanese-Phosphatase-superfamily-associated Protein domain
MIEKAIQLGEPVAHRGAVLVPLYPRQQPRAAYVTLDEALPLGFRITEVDAAGSVPELLATNLLEDNVLLYDGEELLGAKQNRILKMTVLLAAASATHIPVSCVEEGRWHTRSAAFAAAPHAAYPDLRRRKAERLSAAPFEHGVAQAAVWDEVRAKASRLDVSSPTRAQADIYRSRGDALAALRRAFPLQPGQCGALLVLGDGICLDYVSRPDAFARLYAKLLEGYLLDALECLDGEARDPEDFLRALESANSSRRPSAGLGNDVRLRGDGVVGSALELDGEVIQLSAPSRAMARLTCSRPGSRGRAGGVRLSRGRRCHAPAEERGKEMKAPPRRLALRGPTESRLP